MSKASEIKESMERILGLYGRDLVTLYIAEVTSVDQSARTCEVKVVHGDAAINIPGVALSAAANDGQILSPAVGSTVMVGVTTQQTAFLLLSSDLEKYSLIIDRSQLLLDANGMTLLDGSYDGLVKVHPLVSAINEIQQDINQLKLIFSTAWIVTPSDGGAALKAAAAAWAGSILTPTVAADLENQYIKHGAPL